MPKVWRLSVTLILTFAATVRAGEQPNIVFILADDVGDQAIGCYGGMSFATPRIDALAARGLRERMLILFMADNGTPRSYYYTPQGDAMLERPIEFQWIGEIVRGGKGDLTDAGTRVPLVASWPGTP